MADYKSMTKNELIDELERRDAADAPAPAPEGFARVVVLDEKRRVSVNEETIEIEPGVPTNVPLHFLPVLDGAAVPYEREDV